MQKNTAVFSSALTAMLTGRSGGANLLYATGAKNGFTHGQQVGWHYEAVALFSLITSSGDLVMAGYEPANGKVYYVDKNFIDVCQWGSGKGMSQYFSNAPAGQSAGSASSLGISVQLTYPTQWYPGQTYPGTVNNGVNTPTVNTNTNTGGSSNTNTGGSSNTGGLGTNLLGGGSILGGSSNTGGSNSVNAGTTNTLVLVLIIAAVGGLVYYLAKKK